MLVEIKKMNKEEVTVVTSLDVAETFEKNHRDVMESIRNIGEAISTAEFSALFYLDSYKASNGKTNPMYLMTRDGFTLLAMGYNGDKAMKFKLAYIKQFNEMEKVLIGKQKEREKGIAVRLIPHIRISYIRRYSEKTQNVSAKNMAYPKRRIFGNVLARKNGRLYNQLK